MALNFNAEPYYDNFDETKKFYRILFKPGYAVQARELTQLQTEIQDQITKFGKNIFVEGAVVLGGERAFEDDILSIKLNPTYNSSSIDVSKFNDTEVTGLTSGTKAFVKLATTINTTDPHTLLVKIISGSEFTAGEDLTVTVNGLSYNATIASSAAFNSAMIFSVQPGVFFTKGNFVYNDAQVIAVDKYTNTSSKNIGFTANEIVISSTDDETLLDNAQGSFNYAAPGADRYSIDLVLTAKELSDSIDDFFEIARVVNGKLVSNKPTTIYSEIGKEMARRTYDESGDYTVKEWPIQIIEHVDGDSTKFSVALDPGKAYIKGFEFETISQEYITIDRARDIDQADNIDVNCSYGNFVFVSTLSGVFDTTAFTSVSLKNASATEIGTAKVRYISYVSGTPGSTAIYKLYLFNIVMGNTYYFKDVRTITTAASASATIDGLSRIGGTGDAFLSGSDSPGLVFPISNNYVKTIRSSTGVTQSDYALQRAFNSVNFSSGQATISTNTSLERFVGSGTLSDTVKNQSYHVVVTAQGTSSFAVGTVLPFTTSLSRSIVLSTPSTGVVQSATFNVGATVAFTATIVASINANTQSEKIKVLSAYTKGVITATLNQTLGGKDVIANASGTPGISDVYDILGVYNIGSNTGSTVSVNSTTGAITWNSVAYTDVTSRYTLDNGQRAELYDWANLTLTGTAPTTNTDNLLVVYRNFAHTGNGFCSVDSYSIPYEDIPSFTDQATGKVYNLRDSIDFRPRKADGSTSLNNSQLPSPDGTFNCDYQYYLGRMDKIIAMPNKTFEVKKGVSAVYPTVPTDNSDGMNIYVLIVPPYTGELTEISVKYVDNKRYTMRDIGKLDKRIQNLEYYTQLSLLEKQAKDTSIPDSSNFEKFKNGFAVDPFTSQDIFAAGASAWAQRKWSWWTSWFNGSNSWNSFGAMNYTANSIAEVANMDFNCAIDPVNQEMRAPFNVDFSYFNPPALVDTSAIGELVSLNFTETTAIEQLTATKSVNINPFNIIKFNGSLALYPSFDQWVDTAQLPATNAVVDVQLPDAAGISNTVITPGGGRVGRGRFKVTSTSTTVNTNELGSTTTSLGASVVDVQFVPFIRANTIIGLAKGLKPLTKVYCFVENEDVSNLCRPITLVTITGGGVDEFKDLNGNFETLTFSNGTTAKLAYYSSPLLADASKRNMSLYDFTGPIVVGNTFTSSGGGTGTVAAAPVTYNLGDDLIADETGVVPFVFNLPAGRFKTGERTIRLIDDPNNDIVESKSTSESKYTANGIIQTKQDNILTTRSIQRQAVTTIEGHWYDPLAQTFNIDPRAYPQGFHVSSIDIYFKKKSNTVPVKLQIRRTVNGYPESWNAIPFAEIELPAEQINVSANASVPTTFTYPAPLYLAPADYAIVLISQCDDYEVWVAEMGKVQIGGTKLVDKQPYNGSLFISQNAATWTAVDNQDLVFKLKRAVFNTSGTATYEITDPASIIEYQTMYANSSNITPAGTSITWEAAVYANGNTTNTDFSPIDINQDINFGSLRQLQAKAGLGFSSLILKATLETLDDAVSPVIDSAALSMITVKNIINNLSTNETNKQGGDGVARYITKPINLASGFDASNLYVTIDINKPAGTNVKVYYKTLPSEKVTPIADESWVEMVQDVPVAFSTSDFDYKEHRFVPVGAINGYGVPQNNPITARFNAFQVKIVLLSTNVAVSPRVRDLRAIALDS